MDVLGRVVMSVEVQRDVVLLEQRQQLLQQPRGRAMVLQRTPTPSQPTATVVLAGGRVQPKVVVHCGRPCKGTVGLLQHGIQRAEYLGAEGLEKRAKGYRDRPDRVMTDHDLPVCSRLGQLGRQPHSL